jgi:hypothetical protein
LAGAFQTSVASLPVLLTGDRLSYKRKLRCLGTLLVGIGLAASWEFFISPARAGAAGRTLAFHDDFSSGNLNNWSMPYPSDWEVLSEDGLHYLHMKRSRPPGVPRRPLQFARLKKIRVGSFDLEANVRRQGGSMIIVFNYVDTLHFYYVHLSVNPGRQIAVHNGIFIVDGGPRRRIAGIDAPAALPDRSWHTVRIVRDVGSGAIRVFVDHHTKPLFVTIDRTFSCGEIGVGSFDETGDFAKIRLRSDDSGCSGSPGGK